MSRIEVITSVERRRRWSASDKTRLVAAMEEPGSGLATALATITIAFGAQVRMTIEGAPDAATLSLAIGALAGRDRQR